MSSIILALAALMWAVLEFLSSFVFLTVVLRTHYKPVPSYSLCNLAVFLWIISWLQIHKKVLLSKHFLPWRQPLNFGTTHSSRKTTQAKIYRMATPLWACHFSTVQSFLEWTHSYTVALSFYYIDDVIVYPVTNSNECCIWNLKQTQNTIACCNKFKPIATPGTPSLNRFDKTTVILIKLSGAGTLQVI